MMLLRTIEPRIGGFIEIHAGVGLKRREFLLTGRRPKNATIIAPRLDGGRLSLGVVEMETLLEAVELVGLDLVLDGLDILPQFDLQILDFCVGEELREGRGYSLKISRTSELLFLISPRSQRRSSLTISDWEPTYACIYRGG